MCSAVYGEAGCVWRARGGVSLDAYAGGRWRRIGGDEEDVERTRQYDGGGHETGERSRRSQNCCQGETPIHHTRQEPPAQLGQTLGPLLSIRSKGILSHSSHTHRDYSDGDDDAYRDVLFVRITDPHCSQNRLNDTHEIFLHGGRRHGLVVLRSVQSGGNCSKSPNRLSIYYLIGLNHLRNDTTYFAFSRALVLVL